MRNPCDVGKINLSSYKCEIHEGWNKDTGLCELARVTLSPDHLRPNTKTSLLYHQV